MSNRSRVVLAGESPSKVAAREGLDDLRDDGAENEEQM